MTAEGGAPTSTRSIPRWAVLWLGRLLIAASVIAFTLFIAAWVHFRLLPEPRDGLCGGAGVGYAHAEGPLLVFLVAIAAITSLMGWALIRSVRGPRTRCSTFDI